jgi:hypothetical protein
MVAQIPNIKFKFRKEDSIADRSRTDSDQQLALPPALECGAWYRVTESARAARLKRWWSRGHAWGVSNSNAWPEFPASLDQTGRNAAIGVGSF